MIRQPRKRRKLTLHPHGVIYLDDRERITNPDNQPPLQEPRARVWPATEPDRSNSGGLNIALKGTATILLVAIAALWANESANHRSGIIHTGFILPADTVIDNASAKQSAANTNNQLTWPGEVNTSTTTDKTTTRTVNQPQLQSNLTLVEIPSSASNTTTKPVSSDRQAVTLKINRENPDSISVNANAALSANEQGSSAFSSALAESTTYNEDYFVSAYRAILFSNLSATANETPIAHGTRVNVIEELDEWVRITVADIAIDGFIHYTQLSTGQLNTGQSSAR